MAEPNLRIPGSSVVPLATAWWQAECDRFGLDQDDPALRLAPPPGVRDQATAPTGVDPCPAGIEGASWLGSRYVEALPAEQRSRDGAYYTPRILAQRLVEQAWAIAPQSTDGLVVDPACGAGALLGAAAERIVAERSPEAALAWCASRLRGRDLDPLAVWLCNLTVGAAVLPAWADLPPASRPAIPQVAAVGDGLADRDPASLVLTNPPFGRVRLPPAERAEFARSLYGHANRATLFLHRAVLRLDRAGAAAAFVMPASVVGGAYFQRLRGMLIEEAPPAWMAFVATRNGVFPGQVLQESVLGVFVRGGSAGIECERLVMNGGTARGALGTMPLPVRGREPWLLPRTPEDAALIRAAGASPGRLADHGWRISTGPLVWNRHRDQLSSEPGPGRIPVVWAQDLSGGSIRPSPRRSERWCQPREGQGWLMLDRPAVLVQRTTAPEQRRRLVPALLDEATLTRMGGKVIVENHLNVCTWDGAGPIDPTRLVRFLGSDEADRLYRCLTGSVAVSAFELGALPVPAPEDWAADRFPGAGG